MGTAQYCNSITEWGSLINLLIYHLYNILIHYAVVVISYSLFTILYLPPIKHIHYILFDPFKHGLGKKKKKKPL